MKRLILPWFAVGSLAAISGVFLFCTVLINDVEKRNAKVVTEEIQ